MLGEKIGQDYIGAMKARDTIRSATLSFLRSQLKYVMIEKKVEALEDAEVIEVIKKQIKQREDSIEQFTKGGRQELVDKEKAELAILKSYLPQEMPEDQVKAVIAGVIQETGATGLKDMGNVMKAVLAKTGDRTNNRVVSAFVKQMLSQL